MESRLMLFWNELQASRSSATGKMRSALASWRRRFSRGGEKDKLDGQVRHLALCFTTQLKIGPDPFDVYNRTSTIIVPTERTHNNQQPIVCQFSCRFSLQPDNATAARSSPLSSTKAILCRAFTG